MAPESVRDWVRRTEIRPWRSRHALVISPHRFPGPSHNAVSRHYSDDGNQGRLERMMGTEPIGTEPIGTGPIGTGPIATGPVDTGRRWAEADADLIQRARHDRDAFGAIYDMYVRRVYAFCLATMNDREDAKDATAQTFESALRAIARYEDRGVPFSSWLLRIAANVIAMRARHRCGIIVLGENALRCTSCTAGDGDAAAWVERWERAERLQQHLAALPADYRMVLIYRYRDDLTLAEVAARMGRSHAAIRQLVRRALIAIRARLAVCRREAGSPSCP